MAFLVSADGTPQPADLGILNLMARLNLDAEDAEDAIVVSVSGTIFRTTEAVLTKVRGSFLDLQLRHREDMSKPEGADIAINRDSTLFAHVLAFMRAYPDGHGMLEPSLVDADTLGALHAEAGFYLLPPLSRLIESRLALLAYQPNLALCDLVNREMEDVLRDLIRSDRNAPAIEPLHVGLVDIFASDSPLIQSPGAHPVLLAEPRPAYPYLLDDLNPPPSRDQRVGPGAPAAAVVDPVTEHLLYEGGIGREMVEAETAARAASLIVHTSDIFASRFEQFYPGVVGCLNAAVRESGVPTSGPSLCGWFIAGGSALRALQHEAVSDRLFRRGDVDVFVYARGQDAAENATKLAEAVCEQLVPQAGPPSQGWRRYRQNTIHRTLFTLNIKLNQRTNPPVQIVLRVYHSPAEVLLGFDVDCCCIGYDGTRVWALPRALDALRFGHTVVNPLHAWPRQPSYELRLAKYAARGWAVAVPGLKIKRIGLQGLNRIVSGRLTTLRGVARILHIHLALALPENNPWYHGAGGGPPAGYRGGTRPHDWEAALRRTFGFHTVSVDGIPQTTLPVDEDRTRHLIEDPYGWINAYLGNEGPPASRWGRPRGDDIALKMVSGDCFDDIYDAGRDDLHIPRVMAWAVEPRSREYMNMELPPAELHELYFASLERRVTDQRADYSEEGLREMGAPVGLGGEDDDSGDSEDDYAFRAESASDGAEG